MKDHDSTNNAIAQGDLGRLLAVRLSTSKHSMQVQSCVCMCHAEFARGLVGLTQKVLPFIAIGRLCSTATWQQLTTCFPGNMQAEFLKELETRAQAVLQPSNSATGLQEGNI